VSSPLRAGLCGLALAVALAVGAAGASRAQAFALEGFSVAAENQDASPTTQAGAHPYAFRFDLAADEGLGELSLHLPPGFLINPTTVSECSEAAFHTPRTSPHEASASGESCPNSSQIGVVAVDAGGSVRHFGLFNLVPAYGSPAALGLSPFGVPLVLTPRLREGDAGFDLELAGIPPGLDLRGLEVTVWGSPWQSSHDAQRGNCLNEQSGGSYGSCLVFEAAPAPEALIHSYLTLPTTPCGEALAFGLTAHSSAGEAADAEATTPALVSCKKALTIGKVQLRTENAASATGLAFNLAVNDGGGILNPGGIARPAIKTAIVSLPSGLTINPSLAAGLGVCSEADFAREAIGSEPGAGCPNGSKIGDIRVEGELGLPEPMQGALYLAAPYANPLGTLIAVYMVARQPRRGLIVKSLGKIEPAEGSGRLTATFDQLPRLLYTHFTLSLREGQRAALVSPPLCGSYATGLALASWAEPQSFVPDSSSFRISRGEGGGPCPTGGLAPFHPGLLAGSLNPTPRAHTPFYLRMTRTDGEQEITSYSATLPPGLLAKLAGTSECPDGAIAAAAGRSGAAEQAEPSCPASSQIGRTMAGYGLGGTLAWAPGGLFLAGPYHGAPLSVVAIDAALIGPFDLGTVVVRQAIRIDPRTAQASIDGAGSDPIPHILAGIPLHLRDIRVYVDRPGFTLTPTSCDPLAVSSSLGGAGLDPFSPADDTLAASSQRYQLLGCGALGFRPRLTLRLTGDLRHGGFPSLRATYAPRPGDANLQAISVALPPSLFLAEAHLKTDCTRPQFADDACPPGSVIGKARAVTPLMDGPLEGPVYLRASDNPVPDLVADLHGRGIEIEVPGRIDSSPKHGIRANFAGLPDAPVSRVTMTFPGGRHGLLENAEAICRSKTRGNVRFVGQDNATRVLRPRLLAKCPRHRRHRERGRG